MNKRILDSLTGGLHVVARASVLAGLTLFVVGCGSRPTADIRVTQNASGEVESILFFGRYVTDADLQQIKTYPTIKQVAIQECSQVTDVGFASLGEARSLTKLSVIRVNITDAGLAPLAALKSLSDLELSHTQVKGDGLEHLSAAPLERLVITSRAVTAEGLQTLNNFAGTLRELELDCKELSLSRLGSLHELRQLTTLSALPMPAGENLEPIRGLPLQQLYLTCEQIGDESIELLNSLPQLQDLQLTGSQITDAGLEQLRLPALKKLNLSNCIGITDSALAKLQGMPSLESLFVGATSVTAKDLTPLATSKNLKFFIIDGQQFKGDDQSIEALKALLPNCEVVVLRG